MSDIAIVGIGCRFAGAPDLHAYWKMTLEGRDGFGPIPPDRFDVDLYYDENRRATDKIYTRIGGFVDDIRSFPGLHYGIPPRRLEVMDPQHRFALESAVQAVEDAGRTPTEMPHKTGVFMGVTGFEFRCMMSLRGNAIAMAKGAFGHVDDPDAILRAADRLVPTRPYSAPGGLANMTAAMVAQELDLHGPAFTVDSACASGLIAITQAVHQLRNGSIDAALAGGVFLTVTAESFVVFCRIGAMSQQGKCLPFDARADGFVQGDGSAVLVLKRVEDAVRDGDRIYAVIRGVGTNNDGRGDGPMAPHPTGQAEVIEDAWRDAGIDRARIGYLEAHGTGTDVGDVAELEGIRRSFSGAKLAVGSAKANVGHTMSTAGVAGIIRAALAIHHGVIPPMAGFQSAKPDLGLEGDEVVRIPKQPEAWDADERYAGVSSFGFGGTNAHAVVGPAPATRSAPLFAARTAEQPDLVLLSAPDEAALRDLAGRTADVVDADPRITVAGVARVWAKRKPLAVRLGVVAKTRGELIERLRGVAAGESPAGTRLGTAGKAPKIAFLFPGQGAQRVGMLAGIRDRFPVVRDTLDELEVALADQLPMPLTHLLYPERRAEPVTDDVARAQLTDTACQQPAMHACGVALTRLLEKVGVRPHVVTGHSLGEFTAAAAAGVVDAGAAARFVARRGRAMADLPGDHGAMAAVMADADTAGGLLVDGAVVANFNHPRQVVVSGTTEAVAEVVKRAEAANVKAVKLEVSHAFHSPVLAELDPEPLLADLDLHDPRVTVASGIADRPYADAAAAREVFRRHAISPVDFVGALRQCQEAGADLYLQVGAGGPLAAFARGGLPRGTRVLTLAGLDDQDGGASLLETLAALWVEGVPVDARAITGDAEPASVPPQVLPREPYWPVKDEPQLAAKLPGASASAATPSAAKTAAPAAQAASPAPAREPAAQAGGETDEVLDRVLAVIARVSAYPKDALKPEMGLQEDLGFDSLMVGDLATGLADAFPGLGGIPQELLINKPTVGDIVAYARDGRGTGAVEANDDAPLSGWRPTWVAAAFPALPQRAVRKGARILAIDLPGVAAAFPEGEVRAVGWSDAADADEVDLIVASGADPLALIGVLAAQDRKGGQPDVLIALDDTPLPSAGSDAPNPAAEAVAGVLRAMAREWPESVCKAVRFAATHPAAAVPPVDRAAVLRREWTSADRTPDVRHAGIREVVALEPAPTRPRWTPAAGETVLITGGTRGIGAKLGARLVAAGCKVLLVGRGATDEVAAALVADGKAAHLKADVTDAAALSAATAPHGPVTAVVHAAGVLADGPIGDVSADRGRAAWAVKVDGWRNALAAAPNAKVALAIGSWAGRFGNRHQAWYAAANAALAGVPAPCRAIVAEFGPWSSSEMVRTIPAPVQQAMRAEGVDFVGDEAGLDALLADLAGAEGIVVHGRELPEVQRVLAIEETLSTETHPYLLDHAIEGTPILPLASAADLIAATAALDVPFEVVDLRLFQGITVDKPVRIEVSVRADRAEVRAGDRRSLAYRARVRPTAPVEGPAIPEGGEAPKLPLAEFYGGLTFHGPMLQGITAIDAVGDTFVRGRVRTGRPAEWIPGSPRERFAIDPLAFDSAMQLSAYVAWIRYGRAGTPVGFARYVQVRPAIAPELTAVVSFGPIEGDRFTGTIRLYDEQGLVAVAEEVAAELRKVEGAEATFDVKPEWVDFAAWPAVKDLEQRLQMAALVGIRNPYFSVHEGTAKNVTVVGGRELVNFSSYNYLGLSGDPRVLADVEQAIHRYGTSVSASRVASGERPFHGELEKLLAECQGTEDSVVFTAGHATNVTAIGHLMGPKDLVLHDELIHDSALQGIKLSGAARRAFKHDDPADLERQLKQLRRNFEKVLIVVEGVYSMDGDICQLPAYLELKKKHGALLMVDEAHSFGIVGATGCGVREHFGIDGREVDLWMGTLSKSLASCGGWIAASAPLVKYLRYTAPGFVYSAGLTPANGQAALSSLKLMLAEPWRVAKLQSNSAFFQRELERRGVDTGPARGGSAVVPAVTGNSMHALMLSQRLNDQGINVQPIVYPAVADDAARLRFFLSSTHTEEQLAWTAERVADTLAAVRSEFRA